MGLQDDYMAAVSRASQYKEMVENLQGEVKRLTTERNHYLALFQEVLDLIVLKVNKHHKIQ